MCTLYLYWSVTCQSSTGLQQVLAQPPPLGCEHATACLQPCSLGCSQATFPGAALSRSQQASGFAPCSFPASHPWAFPSVNTQPVLGNLGFSTCRAFGEAGSQPRVSCGGQGFCPVGAQWRRPVQNRNLFPRECGGTLPLQARQPQFSPVFRALAIEAGMVIVPGRNQLTLP